MSSRANHVNDAIASIEEAIFWAGYLENTLCEWRRRVCAGELVGPGISTRDLFREIAKAVRALQLAKAAVSDEQ